MGRSVGFTAEPKRVGGTVRVQVHGNLKGEIEQGVSGTGDYRPGARSLAGNCGVSAGIVSKAFSGGELPDRETTQIYLNEEGENAQEAR